MIPDKQINIDKQYLEIEQKVIHLMLQHADIIAEMLDANISPSFFHSKHIPLVQAIYYTFQISEGKRLLTDEHYRNILLSHGVKGDITIAMQVYHECMYGVHLSITKDDFDYLKNQLIESFIHIKMVAALKVFNESLPKLGRLEATRQFHGDIGEAITLTTVKKKTEFLILDELKDKYVSHVDDRVNNKEPNIICNIPEIDEAMNVGFKAGHTTMIVGSPGSHKTNLMLNIAINIFDQGHNVLFLPLEMDWADFVNRVISNITGVSYKKLLNPPLLSIQDQEKIKTARTWISKNEKFAILDVDEQISVPVLSRELEKRANYFAPKLVVVDYIGLLKTQSSFGNRHDLALGDLTKQLKFLGKKLGFHILSAAQLGRADIKRLREEGPEAQLDTTAIKGSQEVSADCEFIFGLTRITDEDDRLKLHNIKARYGASGHTKDLRLDADRCLISSMQPVLGGLKTDALENWDAESPQKVTEKILEAKQKNSEVVFDGMNPDDLDDLDTA